MELATKLYTNQVDGRRFCVHENPAHAKSWALSCIRRTMRQMGVDVVETDQCMFGLRTWGKSRSQLVMAKRPTIFMVKSWSKGVELRRRCDGWHDRWCDGWRDRRRDGWCHGRERSCLHSWSIGQR